MYLFSRSVIFDQVALFPHHECFLSIRGASEKDWRYSGILDIKNSWKTNLKLNSLQVSVQRLSLLAFYCKKQAVVFWKRAHDTVIFSYWGFPFLPKTIKNSSWSASLTVALWNVVKIIVAWKTSDKIHEIGYGRRQNLWESLILPLYTYCYSKSDMVQLLEIKTWDRGW